MLKPISTTLAVLAASAVAWISAADAKSRRLPAGYAWGRCLLEVEGKTYINGRCSYTFLHDKTAPGSFQINGPHQIWGGIDYPEPEYSIGERSADYFAQVIVETDGTGWASWNWDKRATHAGSSLGNEMTRHGACWSNDLARICLWK